MLTREDEKNPCNVRIGGDRARYRRIDGFECYTGETGKTALTFIAEKGEQNITFQFHQESIEQLLNTIIGARPIQLAIEDDHLIKLCRMLIVGHENRERG